MTLEWLRQGAAPTDTDAATRARERQARLTKPRGSLGRLEELAVLLAGMQGTDRPRVDRVRVVVFAADHGVAAENVSAYPQSVTRQMLCNFSAGGAAVNVLGLAGGATVEIVDVGTCKEGPGPQRVVRARCGPGTRNVATSAAMSERQLAEALRAGRDAAARAREVEVQLFIGGEMGIANTTSAAALACALLRLRPQVMAGPGSGLDDAGVRRKAAVMARALALHSSTADRPLEALRCLGGFEIAALAGAFAACAQWGLPVLVDGFIAGVAALLAVRLCPGASAWMLYAHRSAEPGHEHVLQALSARPLLDLGLRLGEASGALVALPLLRLACAVHAGMSTFEEAGVADAGP